MAFEGTWRWDVAYLLIANPLIVAALLRLSAYRRRVIGASERARTSLLSSAVTVGWLFGITEIIGDMIPDWPRLGPIGILVSSALLALAVLRFDLLETRRRTYLTAVPLVLLSVAFAIVFPRQGPPNVLAAVILPSLLIGGAIGWPILQTVIEGQRRQRRLALLGRMVAQVAHDLKNPVGAIRGAAQFLLVELDADRPLAPHRWFLEEIVEQTRRVEQSVSLYRRLDDPELSRRQTDLVPIVEAALRRVPAAVQVEREFQATAAPIDADLVRAAVENVVDNAIQAMKERGRLRVGCSTSDTAMIWIEDQGPGIPLRSRIRVFDDFHTTKAQGTGLGLPFVRRVMEAHKGYVRLEDGAKGGLRVVLHFPTE